MPSASVGISVPPTVGVVGGLGGHHPVGDAGAELLRPGRGGFRDRVGGEGRDPAADSGQGAEGGADDAGADQVTPVPQRLDRGGEGGHDELHLGLCRIAALEDLLDDLGDGEDADHHRHEVDPAQEPVEPEGEAVDVGELVVADGREDQAQHARHQPFHRRFLRDDSDDEQAGEGQREILGRREVDGDIGEDRGEEDQHEPAQDAAHGGGGDGEADRLLRKPPLHHRIAVEQRRRGQRRARDAYHDRGDRSAAGAGDEDRDEEPHPRDRRHVIGERQQQDDPHQRAEPRQHPDQQPHQRAGADGEERLGGQKELEAVHERHERHARASEMVVPAGPTTARSLGSRAAGRR